MASLCPKVLSEYANVSFDVLNDSHVGYIEDAIEFLQEELLTTAKKSDLIFTNIVVCRSVVLKKPNGWRRHDQSMFKITGSYSYDQFIKILQYPRDMLLTDWNARMEALSIPKGEKTETKDPRP